MIGHLEHALVKEGRAWGGPHIASVLGPGGPEIGGPPYRFYIQRFG